MVFNWFKKKEVVDLRKGQSDVVVSEDVKKRFANQQAAVSAPTPVSVSSSTSQANSTSQESGGFFSFFGSSNASEVSNMQTPTTTETQISGNTEIMDKIEKLEKRIGELFTGVSRLTDRVDLTERKIERLERKVGINENY